MSSFLHYLFTISLQERMYYVLDGGDRLFRHLAFWLIFLPSWHGDCTSIDAVHTQNKRKRCLAMYIAQKHKSSKSKRNKSSGSIKTTHYLNSECIPKSTPNPLNPVHSLSHYANIRSFATAAILIQVCRLKFDEM